MRLLGIDFETTGLDPQKDEITEIGYAVVDTDNYKKPLVLRSQLCSTQTAIPKEITTLTGITNDLLSEVGVDVKSALVSLVSTAKKYGVSHFVAHNAPFDRAFLEENIKKAKIDPFEISWIDTKKDIPWAIPIRNTSLITVAAEHGFLNPFPHAALFDVFTMLKVLGNYDINEVIKFRDEQVVFVRALVDFNNKDLAKKRGFFWQECEGKFFDKQWVKAIKERYLDAELKACTFDTKILNVSS